MPSQVSVGSCGQLHARSAGVLHSALRNPHYEVKTCLCNTPVVKQVHLSRLR